MATIIYMYCIRKYKSTNGHIPFDEWLDTIKDKSVKARLLKRLKKVQLGNLGDWNSVGDGIFELREHFNRGFWIYYGIEKQTVILLLCGGGKSTQAKDIRKARQYWREYKEGN